MSYSIREDGSCMVTGSKPSSSVEVSRFSTKLSLFLEVDELLVTVIIIITRRMKKKKRTTTTGTLPSDSKTSCPKNKIDKKNPSRRQHGFRHQLIRQPPTRNQQ
ncbi:Uncharacterised protein at_DN0694 [Pycnogonum litorale]